MFGQWGPAGFTVWSPLGSARVGRGRYPCRRPPAARLRSPYFFADSRSQVHASGLVGRCASLSPRMRWVLSEGDITQLVSPTCSFFRADRYAQHRRIHDTRTPRAAPCLRPILPTAAGESRQAGPHPAEPFDDPTRPGRTRNTSASRTGRNRPVAVTAPAILVYYPLVLGRLAVTPVRPGVDHSPTCPTSSG